MPAAVGSNAFWKQATSWITGQDTQDDARQHRSGLAEVGLTRARAGRVTAIAAPPGRLRLTAGGR